MNAIKNNGRVNGMCHRLLVGRAQWVAIKRYCYFEGTQEEIT